MWLLPTISNSTVPEICYSNFGLGTSSFSIPVEASPAAWLIDIEIQTEIGLQTESIF